MDTATREYATAVRESTDTYLERATDCVGHLPDALDAYGRDPSAFETAVDRIAARESDCDDALRAVRALLGESPPNYTAAYLRADDLARLYVALDAVPNSVERFARELRAIEPDLGDDLRATFREMAVLTGDATAVLAGATDDYVGDLVTEGDLTPVADAVEEVSALESECDDLKYRALFRAFDAYPTADALVVRSLVLTLDAAVDAAEDAADQLLVANSADV